MFAISNVFLPIFKHNWKFWIFYNKPLFSLELVFEFTGKKSSKNVWCKKCLHLFLILLCIVCPWNSSSIAPRAEGDKNCCLLVMTAEVKQQQFTVSRPCVTYYYSYYSYDCGFFGWDTCYRSYRRSRWVC